jgi:hypothetical protein
MSPTHAPKIWFTLLEGKQHGPFTFTALVQGAKSGHLDPEDGVCRLGWEAWRLARDVPGLFKQESESVTFYQEQDADSNEEEDTGGHERSESWPTEKRGVYQEQDADSMEEEDTRNHERSDIWPAEKRGGYQEQDADSVEEEDTRDHERSDSWPAEKRGGYQEQDADSVEEEDTRDHKRSDSWPTEKRGGYQEQDADSVEEEDTRDHERSDSRPTEMRRKSDDRAAARKAAASAFMTSKPLPADSVLYKTFTGDDTVSADERPAFGASAGRPESVSKRLPEQKNRIKDAWIVTFSVLAVLLAVVGAGWAATSLGIIRVTLLF